MDYNKLTKAELIEQLKETVPLEKYTTLQKKIEIKDNRIADLESKLSRITDKFDNLNIEHTQKINQAKQSSDSIVTRAKEEYQKIKDDYEYLEDIVQNEYELVNLITQRTKQEQEYSDKLLKLYHKILFKENEK